MKKIKLNYFKLFVILSLAFLSSCDDSDAKKNNEAVMLEATFGEQIILSDQAGLYLMRESDSGIGYKYREYAITDAEYVNNEFENNYTYWISFFLVVPTGSEFEAGEYPQRSQWAATGNMGYIDTYFDNYQFFTNDSSSDFSPVIVNSGLDANERMSISFEGKLISRTWVSNPDGSTSIVEGEVNASIDFAAKVIDARQ